jgi:hypothetical protein
MQSSNSDQELWRAIPQTAYYVVAIIAALWALVVYRRNRRLEQAKWLLTFYDKFYESDKYKAVRELLDSQADKKFRLWLIAKTRHLQTISTSLSMWQSFRVQSNCEPVMSRRRSVII